MMKIKLIIAIVCILGTFGMSGVELSQLKVEGLVNPKGVECSNPRFSWVYCGQRGDKRGFKQQKYRILVGTDSVKLSNGNRADMWDSGMRRGDGTTAVYEGSALQSRGIYYWKVETVGNNGQRYESEVSVFEQGLLREADWHNARWIGIRREMSPMIPRNAERWTDYTLSCDVCVESGCANLLFRSLYATDMRYELQIEAGNEGVVKVFFNKWNERTLLGDYRVDGGIVVGRYYPVEVICNGKNIEVIFDGKKLGNGPIVDDRQLSGSVGVGAIKDNGEYGRARFDNFCVKKGDKVLFSDDFEVAEIINFQDQVFYGGSVCEVEEGSLSVSGLISMIDDKRDVGAPLLRKEFAARKPIVRARAYVACAGYFEMTVNGKKVTDAWMGEPKN